MNAKRTIRLVYPPRATDAWWRALWTPRALEHDAALVAHTPRPMRLGVQVVDVETDTREDKGD